MTSTIVIEKMKTTFIRYDIDCSLRRRNVIHVERIYSIYEKLRIQPHNIVINICSVERKAWSKEAHKLQKKYLGN